MKYVKRNKTVGRLDKRTRNFDAQAGCVLVVAWMVILVIVIETGVL